MQRATKLALLVAVAGTTLTTTTGFADTASQNIPNTTTATSVADTACRRFCFLCANGRTRTQFPAGQSLTNRSPSPDHTIAELRLCQTRAHSA